jgi:hypothetical protein
MDREQAVQVLKRIFEECTWVEGKSVKLIPPKNIDSLSNTFQIHIQTNAKDIIPNCILTITKENGLMVKERDGFIIIYKPYPNLSYP